MMGQRGICSMLRHARVFTRLSVIAGTATTALCLNGIWSPVTAQQILHNPKWLLAGIVPTGEDQSKELDTLQK
jgi:hypothetical protein